VIETPLNEFMKSGGGAKCLILRLTERAPETSQPRSSVVSKELRFEGHLLDSGILEKALDATVESGGSFQVLDFRLGKQRQSSSAAAIRISAPSNEVLEKIMTQMVAFGAATPQEPEEDATLEPAPMPGVAPDGFYSTTIYPTEIRLGGQWIRVQDQRMDGVIAVSGENPPVARCKLIRDLSQEDRVAVGASGIRTVRDLKTREPRARFEPEKEFAFMGADVSSERRVELMVEQIAWEMRRIREQAGRIVMVAGPVVMHTGGGEHLARLIRGGYVQALLGGNAIAAHDIEHAFLGTSLGVDLERGKPIHGGHSHHLRAINTIRRCGGIRQAVEKGVLTRGIFFECIKKDVPFCLAGSIRDDGPLPDTEMDLIKAQEGYARLLKGADMVLMLSSMLHAIGAGNMVPAGVRMVCVDINPAVVTKLSDRGSVESAGIVTDVGLFLNLLEQRLISKEERRLAA
jgi:lysine-ketoglutarate reductase/saccharopine dehydrogenase-like protein (TIGR00300 family)